MSQRMITPEDFFRMKLVSDSQISPDGSKIAYTLQTVDKENSEYKESIWLVGANSPAVQFTSDGSSPHWSPDGSTLAFVSGREGVLPDPQPEESAQDRDKRCGKGKSQIWVISAFGGEARQVTFMRWGAANPKWSPDGSRILFSAKTGEIPETPEHDGKKEPRLRKIDRFMYRFNGRGYMYELRSHLFVVPAAGGTPQQLTDGDWDDGSAQWSPDGAQILFTSDRREDRWLMPVSQIYLMNSDGSDQHQISGPSDTFEYFSPNWSADGKKIASLGGRIWRSGGHTDIFVFAPHETPRLLTENIYVTFSDAIGSDLREDHADETPIWSDDNRTLFVLGNARGAGNLYAFDTETLALTELTTGNHQILGYSFTEDHHHMALAIADTQQMGDIFLGEVHGAAPTRLTNVNAELLEELNLAVPEEFEFTGADGWNIQGWILKPADFDSQKKYPMLLEIHGGPNTCYGYTFFQEFQTLVANGYVVVYTNPRGSTSYGRDFSRAVHGAWGLGDYEDLMAGVDAVLARGYVDEKRLGVLGGSYGGFMTNWIVGHTNRFSAAITERCVSNLVSKYGTSDIGPWMALDNWDGSPWEQPEKYRFHSPITYVNNIQTPLLIIHSEEDWRCPIEQGEQMFTSLKWLKRDVEFIRVEGQNHDLTRDGHPRLRIERMGEVVKWFNKYFA